MYASISQRAASSYRKTLAEFHPCAGMDETTEISQRDLHAFFERFYEDVFVGPLAFGMPSGEDQYIAEDELNEKDKKQAVMQKLKKPREMIIQGLDFLMLAGVCGRLKEWALILDDYPATIKDSAIKPKFLKGLGSSGLMITLSGDQAVLTSPQFPAMLPALKTLALGCAAFKAERIGKFHFARCDFRALDPHYEPDVLELYQLFRLEEFERLSRLHTFFSAKGYKTSLDVGGPFAWTVKYQGNRKIKASPFFQVTFEERYENPLRPQIKCVSTNRLAELLPQQPQALWDDFMGRVYPCQGDKCGWCRNQKALGPSVIEYNGETRTVCWFSNGDIRALDENAVGLIQQYARLHDQLLPEN